MDYTKLKTEIKEIAEIAESVPEAFRSKCFETLLTRLIACEDAPARVQREPSPPPIDVPPVTASNGPSQTPTGSQFTVSTQLRLLMQRTNLTEDEIKKVLLVANGDVHFVTEPTGKKIAEGQIDWALLLALKNCVLNDSLTVDPEMVRSVCQEKGYYDRANFASCFKRTPYVKYFKGKMEAQGQAQSLTVDGQNALADLVRQLAAAP